MQLTAFTLAALLLAVAVTSTVAREETSTLPVTHAIQLLKDMSTAGEEELFEEQKQHAAYKVFCEHATEVKTKAIARAEQQIESLEAKIEIASSKIVQFDEEIEKLGSDKELMEHEKQDEKYYYNEVRKEHADWSNESIAWLDKVKLVMEILEDQLRETEKNFSQPRNMHYPIRSNEALLAEIPTLLTQIAASDDVPDSAKRALELFATQDEDLGAPFVAAYEFQAGDILATLDKLNRLFKAMLTSGNDLFWDIGSKSELTIQNLDHQVKRAEIDIGWKHTLKTHAEEAKREAEADLIEIKQRKGEDESFLGLQTSTCSEKAVDFDIRQTLRKKELHTIEEAIAILESPAVAGAAAAHLAGLSAPAPETALGFAQVNRTVLAALRSASGGVDGVRRARDYLEQQAHSLQSSLLSAVAAQVNGDEPFGQVKKMIEDVIVRLEGDNHSLSSQEEWCEEELARNNGTRDAKTQAMTILEADADALVLEIAVFTKEIAEMITSAGGNREEKAKETELRRKEKATNEKAVKEAKQAQFDIVHATELLKQHFSPTVGLAQQSQHPEAPEIFDSPYEGMQQAGNAVIVLLETILSDFDQLEVNINAGEAEAQAEYDRLMETLGTGSAQAETDIKTKTALKKTKENSLADKHSDLKGTRSELDAAVAYYDTLKPSCVDTGNVFEQRAAARAAELQSLKEALAILSPGRL